MAGGGSRPAGTSAGLAAAGGSGHHQKVVTSCYMLSLSSAFVLYQCSVSQSNQALEHQLQLYLYA